MTTLPHNGTDTSRAAAESMEGVAQTDEERVLALVKLSMKTSHQGHTDDEIERYLKLSHQSASARRNGLVRKGLLRDSGERRITRSGRKAIVWIPT